MPSDWDKSVSDCGELHYNQEICAVHRLLHTGILKIHPGYVHEREVRRVMENVTTKECERYRGRAYENRGAFK